MNGVSELKSHPWFANFDFKALKKRKIKAPFIPDIKLNNFDHDHVNNPEWKDEKAVSENIHKLYNPEV